MKKLKKLIDSYLINSINIGFFDIYLILLSVCCEQLFEDMVFNFHLPRRFARNRSQDLARIKEAEENIKRMEHLAAHIVPHLFMKIFGL
jgi:hypothetical protein